MCRMFFLKKGCLGHHVELSREVIISRKCTKYIVLNVETVQMVLSAIEGIWNQKVLLTIEHFTVKMLKLRMLFCINKRTFDKYNITRNCFM